MKKTARAINMNHLHAKGLIAAAILLILVAIPAFNTVETGNVVSGCRDTDAGLNYAIKGSINFGSSIRTDYCIGEKVAEFYCEAGEAKLTMYDCPKYCVGGRCAG